MWGPSGTGKTTFLAALSIGLIRRGSEWRVTGADKDSTNWLIDLTSTLTRERAFPPSTVAIAHYRWKLDGRFKRKVRRGWFGWEWRRLAGRAGRSEKPGFAKRPHQEPDGQQRHYLPLRSDPGG